MNPMPERRLSILPSDVGRLVWAALALLLLLGFNLVFTDGFFRIEVKDGQLYGTLIDILNRGTPILLAALGMTVVIATGGVDLSVGAILAIAGSLAALLLTRTTLSPALVVAATLLLCTVAGAWNGGLVALFGVQPIVATLVLMVAGRGVAQLLTEGQIITFDNPAFSALGTGHLLGLPVPVVIVFGAFIVSAAVLRGTALAMFIESVGNNETASRLAGVNVRLIKTLVYAFSGLCAGLAGVIVAADIKAADANNAGLYLELDAILAVVIGGTSLMGGRFSLVGTVLGALIIQTLTTTILTRGVPVEYTLAVKAIVVIAVCLLQSEPLQQTVLRKRGVA